MEEPGGPLNRSGVCPQTDSWAWTGPCTSLRRDDGKRPQTASCGRTPDKGPRNPVRGAYLSDLPGVVALGATRDEVAARIKKHWLPTRTIFSGAAGRCQLLTTSREPSLLSAAPAASNRLHPALPELDRRSGLRRQPPPPANHAARSPEECGSSRGAAGGGFVAVPVCSIGAMPIRATVQLPSRWVATQLA